LGFRNVLRFKEAVPSLVKLLAAGGVWSTGCERAYHSLAGCKVEKVKIEIIFLLQPFYFIILQAICYVLNACVEQAELLNKAIFPLASYSLDDLLVGGETTFRKAALSKVFGLGTDKALSNIIKPNTPISEAIKKLVWEPSTFTHIFGKVVGLKYLNF
jgi:hypothetical protein